MDYEYSLLIGALKTFNNFDGGSPDSNLEFVYDDSAEGFSKLLARYPVKQIAGNGDELSKALNLLKWCSENVLHNGGTKDVEFIPKTSIDILDYAYQKGREYGVYCRLQAIVFTECCLALGIKSRILHCLPFSPYDFDTHVVSMVFIKSLNKWILLDAGNNRYFTDENDQILSPLEIRERLGNDAYIKCNADDEPYKRYMAKNLFYFKSLKYNTFGSDLRSDQATIYCAPQGFDVLGRETAYCEYAIKNSPPEFVEGWEKALAEFRDRPSFINVSASVFF